MRQARPGHTGVNGGNGPLDRRDPPALAGPRFPTRTYPGLLRQTIPQQEQPVTEVPVAVCAPQVDVTPAGEFDASMKSNI